MPQIVRVKQRGIYAKVISDLVNGSFDVLSPGVHCQQRVACTSGLRIVGTGDNIMTRT